VTVKLQELKNLSEVTVHADMQRRAAEILAAGESEAIRIVQQAENDLLQQKAHLLAESGDFGKIALFVQQRLAGLFQVYQQHAQGLAIQNLVIMDDQRGVNGVVNRGPEALVDFLRHFEAAFGIRVRDLLTMSSQQSEEKSV
jgi:regulator of protease activity HflC (stomatin/prohibitin superfamily)